MRFLILFFLAKKYLQILATLAAIKQVFFIISNIITKNKNKLSLETVS